jgi:Fe-S-cluster-containing hydrogenase component 2
VTACQQACPASAITFGNINDKQSRVAKLQADERSYQVLADLNTRPRTKYVAAVLNPNPNSKKRRWNTAGEGLREPRWQPDLKAERSQRPAN